MVADNGVTSSDDMQSAIRRYDRIINGIIVSD